LDKKVAVAAAVATAAAVGIMILRQNLKI